MGRKRDGTVRIARSAGTRTVGDVVRLVLGRGRAQEEDWEDVTGGKEVAVVTYKDPESRSRTRSCVQMGTTERARQSIEAVLGPAPWDVSGVHEGTTWHVDWDAFSCLSGTSADQSAWTIAVPTLDVPLVRYCLSHSVPRESRP